MDEYLPGLAGVPATKSNISSIDGEKGILAYRGYDIQELAERSTFEETALLLLDGELPTSRELEDFDPLQVDGPQRTRLLSTDVFARVSPAAKLKLVTLFQKAGHVVAMTGDGVNDAPALKKADIGIAMGQRGTQVARDAAHMVLKDDAFATIIDAMRQGRIIFGNIRKSLMFMLCTNVAEVAAVGVASLFEIIPTFLIKSNVPTIATVTPYTPLELAGRDIYLSEGTGVALGRALRSLELLGQPLFEVLAVDLVGPAGDEGA